MRIAVIGTNFISHEFMAAATVLPEFTLAGVCGSSKEKAEAFAAKYGGAPACGDYRELLKVAKPDGVYIATPNQLHHAMALFFLEAGIPVLCEKPLAPTLWQAREMVEKAQQKQVTLLEGIKPLYLPSFAVLRAALPRCGKLVHAQLSFCRYSSRYDSYRQGEVQSAFRREYMGGSLMDIGIYPLYHAMGLFGKPQRALGTARLLSSGVDGSGTALLDYGEMDASIVHAKCSTGCIDNEIQGEDGSLVYNTGSMPADIRFVPRAGAPELLTVDQPLPLMAYEIVEFIRCAKAGAVESPLAPHSLYLEVYAVTDALRAQTGVRYEVDGCGLPIF